ncbi:MAG: alpha/beta fold hydrolase [Marinobacter sp.]|uniref:alpha/beta fold hydrolase n=1 Tax=Marinobacter sp. TaxID=50741 RepID=UPI003F9E0608
MNEPATSPDICSEAGLQERQWPLQNITLAGLSWPANNASQAANTPVIMLHGWLDNSLTFCQLAPELARLSALHAVDFAGHGHSDHRPAGQSYQLMDYVADIAELIETHICGPEQTTKVDIVGHSLGGIVGSLYAAAFPERIRKLVMIDSLGALSRSADETIPQLRKSIRKRISGSGRSAVYGDIAAAAKVREGGLSPLSHEAALALMPRNLKPADGGYSWRTDARLRHPSPLMMSESQVVASLAAVQSRTLLVSAREGLLTGRKGLDNRLSAMPNVKKVEVPGGHHCHLDGDIRPVADVVRNFLNNE